MNSAAKKNKNRSAGSALDTGRVSKAGSAAGERKGKLAKSELIKNHQSYLMALPAVLIFFLFSYLPLPGIIMAFKDFNLYDGIFRSPWAQPLFFNFKFYFESEYFLQTTLNTFFINILNMFFGTVLSILSALLLNELIAKRARKAYQSIVFLPYFFSIILLGKLVTLFTDTNTGLLNSLITSMGGTAKDWNSISWIWVPIVVIVFLWKNVGYSLIVYYVSITGIDTEIYESADIDGAGRLRQIWNITLPILKPTIIVLILLSVGRVFYGDFQLIYAVVGNDVGKLKFTDIIETFLYRSVMEPPAGVPQYAMSTAIGLYQTILGLVTIFLSNYIAKKYDESYALF